MKKEDKQLLIYGGIAAIAYFGVLRPILKKVGIVKSAEDLLVINQANIPNQQNPFSPAFYKYGPAGTKLLTVAAADQYAARIYNAMGWVYDDEAAVYSVFRSLSAQSQVSFIAERFKIKYGSDLLEFLKKGKNQINAASGLNSDELATVINIVNKLPKYK
jgi:hypothetical protein